MTLCDGTAGPRARRDRKGGSRLSPGAGRGPRSGLPRPW
jgi:hypothetical protein